MDITPAFKDPAQAFEEAIAKGYLSENPNSRHYAGRYMYMFTDEQGDQFKHIDTRQYLAVR